MCLCSAQHRIYELKELFRFTLIRNTEGRGKGSRKEGEREREFASWPEGGGRASGRQENINIMRREGGTVPYTVIAVEVTRVWALFLYCRFRELFMPARRESRESRGQGLDMHACRQI